LLRHHFGRARVFCRASFLSFSMVASGHSHSLIFCFTLKSTSEGSSSFLIKTI
jgi:hypothetical protein